MSHLDYTIQGIQHMGIAVSDMDASLKLYRKLFGLDIPFFDAVVCGPFDGQPLQRRDHRETRQHGDEHARRLRGRSRQPHKFQAAPMRV